MNILKNNTCYYIEVNNNIIAYINFCYIDKNIIEVSKTFVDKAYEGRGIGKMLTEELIKDAQKNNLKIKPTCSYTKNYLLKHPELSSLIY